MFGKRLVDPNPLLSAEDEARRVREERALDQFFVKIDKEYRKIVETVREIKSEGRWDQVKPAQRRDFEALERIWQNMDNRDRLEGSYKPPQVR